MLSHFGQSSNQSVIDTIKNLNVHSKARSTTTILYTNIPHVKGEDREFSGVDRYGVQWSN